MIIILRAMILLHNNLKFCLYSCFGSNQGASLRNSSEIGRLPREVNNKNTYEDGDYLMVSLVDGEGQQPQSSSGPLETRGYGENCPPPTQHRGVDLKFRVAVQPTCLRDECSKICH